MLGKKGGGGGKMGVCMGGELNGRGGAGGKGGRGSMFRLVCDEAADAVKTIPTAR